MKSEPISLYSNNEEGLIILNDNGNEYTNQTGGIACHHPTARGYFQPMAIPDELQGVNCCLVDEDKSDEIFIKYNMPMRVDRTRESEEAWLAVDLGFGMKGILTWVNCD